MNSQLKRGVIDTCILHLLEREDMYGYDIIKCIGKYFPETDTSVIYAITRRLNKEGLTEMYYGQESLGPERKYYRITDEGRTRLQEYVADWRGIGDIFSELGVL